MTTQANLCRKLAIPAQISPSGSTRLVTSYTWKGAGPRSRRFTWTLWPHRRSHLLACPPSAVMSSGGHDQALPTPCVLPPQPDCRGLIMMTAADAPQTARAGKDFA